MQEGAPSKGTVLRIAFVGARSPAVALEPVAERLRNVFAGIGQAMPNHAGPPVLQLLTGLADGADQCAAETFLAAAEGARREHVAVLPFEHTVYRDKSPITDQASFERLLQASALVFELDGRWLPDDDAAGPEFAKHCRSRAYRAQAMFMLHRADLLLAVLDPAADVRAGGSAESMQRALALGMPVLLLAVPAGGAARLHLLRSPMDLDLLGHGPDESLVSPQQQPACLAALVRELMPPAGPLPTPPRRIWLEGVWPRLQKRPRRDQGVVGGVPVAPVDPGLRFAGLRDAARKRSARYIGRYRGSFLVTFSFAAGATALAAISLGLMAAAPAQVEAHAQAVLLPLLALAFAKLALVCAIGRITWRVTHEDWNWEGVNARYLAEHLRLLQWLPALGYLRVPHQLGLHHGSGRFSNHDLSDPHAAESAAVEHWLAWHVRAASLPNDDRASRWARIEPRAALRALRTGWIAGQIGYHRDNASAMRHMGESLERLSTFLNRLVIACVVADILALLLASFTHFGSGWLDLAKIILVVFAAALPAAVAATNGILEQSEAQRLADRSAQIEGALADLDRLCATVLQRMAAAQTKDPGSWTLESIAIATRCANLVAEDVAEWRVVYRKHLRES